MRFQEWKIVITLLLILPRVLLLPAARTQDLVGLPESIPQDPRLLRSQPEEPGRQDRKEHWRKMPISSGATTGQLPAKRAWQPTASVLWGRMEWGTLHRTDRTPHLHSTHLPCLISPSTPWLQTQGRREKHTSHRLGRQSPSWGKALSKCMYKKGWENGMVLQWCCPFHFSFAVAKEKPHSGSERQDEWVR